MNGDRGPQAAAQTLYIKQSKSRETCVITCCVCTSLELPCAWTHGPYTQTRSHHLTLLSPWTGKGCEERFPGERHSWPPPIREMFLRILCKNKFEDVPCAWTPRPIHSPGRITYLLAVHRLTRVVNSVSLANGVNTNLRSTVCMDSRPIHSPGRIT